MKKLFFLLILVIGVGCTPKTPVTKVEIRLVDTLKVVSINDSFRALVSDTVSDQQILDFIESDRDTIEVVVDPLVKRKDSLRKDSLQKVKFRRATKIVNGGYIGWEDRLRDWIRIKKILTDTIK